MKFATVLTIFGVCLITLVSSGKPFFRKVDNWVPGEYIIVFKDKVNAKLAVQAIVEKVDPLHLGLLNATRTFKKAINGAVIKTVDASLQLMENLESVAEELGIAYIEEDANVTLAETWNLDRIDQTSGTLDNAPFSPSGDGTGVNVYIVDSGIVDQDEFGNGIPKDDFFNSYDGGKFPRKGDCHGHGTHMAGTIGSMTYGVAKNANLFSVRVFDCDGFTTWGYVLDALDYILDNADPNTPSVINLSLSGGISEAVNTAVNNLYDAGFLPVVAAGNGGIDACSTTPGSAEKALVVGGIDQSDQSIFNDGPCVDIRAPAYLVESLNYERLKKTPTVVKSGTSSAAALTTGVAAVLLQLNPTWTPADVEAEIKASPSIVSGLDTPVLYI